MCVVIGCVFVVCPLIRELHQVLVCKKYIMCVLDQISLVRKVYRKYRKQTLSLGYLDHIMALNGGRHDFTKDPVGSQKPCFL